MKTKWILLYMRTIIACLLVAVSIVSVLVLAVLLIPGLRAECVVECSPDEPMTDQRALVIAEKAFEITGVSRNRPEHIGGFHWTNSGVMMKFDETSGLMRRRLLVEIIRDNGTCHVRVNEGI